MNTPDLWAEQWHKSSHSTDTGGNCVEVAGLPAMVAVRDSKDPHGPALVIAHPEFRTLLRQIKANTLRD